VVSDLPQPICTIGPQEQLRFHGARIAVGDTSLDWEQLHRLSRSADPDRRPLVWMEKMGSMALLQPGAELSTSPDTTAFFALINEAIAASAKSELIVYVHGANSSVPRATAQAAQFRHFTGRSTVVLSFLWSSACSILSYFSDVRNAAASAPEFTRLIELLSAHTTATQIDVLGYSAGAQVAQPRLGAAGRAAAR
jgi:hypothetical protein